MEGYQTDIQALLQDINGNYRDPKHDQSPQSLLLSRRSISKAPSFQAEYSAVPQNALAPISEQQLLSYSIHNDNDLDLCARALLDKPHPHSPWQANSSMRLLPPGRLSLPGHTAPYSPTNHFQHSRAQEQRRAVPGPVLHQYQSGPVQYTRTPPAQIYATSPASGLLPSSPSFVATQQRIHHEAQRDNHCLTLGSSQNLRPLVASSVKDSNEGIVNESRFHNVDTSQDNSFSEVPSRVPYQRRFFPQTGYDRTQPIVQGIPLVSLDELPDRLRSVFRYPLFNAIQSKCFPTAYRSDDNLVVSAPTGGGKTAILEIAICRLIHGFKKDQYKIVYMAPTKSLCSERHRDWQAKFAALDLTCAELTGDTDQGQLRNVQSASIVITTPEKWDSMTRKWKDQSKLMRMVRLFLIDEVHILKESRGATLEAVVSRMKSVDSNIRFVALSATVPNIEDIATWLGQNHTSQHLPATREKFGEEFRPVRLQKHVMGISYRGNDFGFEIACDPKLPSIIAKYSHKKPIMVFCITRRSAVNTAKLLADLWGSEGPQDRHWKGPTQRLVVQDTDLQNTLSSAVAFHHAGLGGADRLTVEKGFLEGQINVICCTSTLALGVNLPCHMVIIKNTVSYQDDGIKEYADLEIMQMLGRAGRPQFDSTAVAVIITKQEKVGKYEKLVSGEELLESCLHLNLIEHLNAEIGLGTIYDLYTAKKWLTGTFLYVRLGLNPEHYNLDGDTVGQNLTDRIERICRRDFDLLKKTKLVTPGNRIKATEFGDAMARYYVKFDTMQALMHLQPRSKMSDILSAIVQADEFRDIRLRANEKKVFKEINNASGIKFPIKVDIAMHTHKRSLIIQSELGGVDYPTDEQYVKHRRQFIQDKAILFSASHRLICCVIDCQIHLQDAVTVRHALQLASSFGARVWDNSPLEMKQIAQVGLVAIRKLAVGGISSIEALEAAEPHRIEMLMSKNPPFGSKLLTTLRDFPKLRVSVKMMGEDPMRWPATIKIKVECGFMNDAAPMFFHRKPIYICLLTERSDGFLLDFRRISAKKLVKGQDVLISAEMLDQRQHITSYIMCDGIAGTMRSAELRPALRACLLDLSSSQKQAQQITHKRRDARPLENISAKIVHQRPETLEDDEFGDDDFKDLEVMNAVKELEFSHIDEFDSRSMQGKLKQLQRNVPKSRATNTEQTAWHPERLDNGKWACNHNCRNKTVCKHMCCREGLDKAPKAPKAPFVSAVSLIEPSHLSGNISQNGRLASVRRSAAPSVPRNEQDTEIETVDLASGQSPGRYERTPPKAFQSFHLHEQVARERTMPVAIRKQPSFQHMKQRQRQTSFLDRNVGSGTSSQKSSTDYDAEWMGDLPSPSALVARAIKDAGPISEHTLTDDSHRWPDGLSSSPPAFICPKVAVTGSYADQDSLEGVDLSQFNDDQSQAETDMARLDDSITMQEDPQTLAATGQTRSQADAHPHLLPPSNASSPWLCHCPPPIEGESSGASRLFFSLDSPEKVAEVGQKRKAGTDDQEEDQLHSTPMPKIARVSSEHGQPPRPSSNAERQTQSPKPIVKPGQPAWVYKFDAAFIAEWQDIVDFV